MLKVYRYKNGQNATFIKNEKVELTNEQAEVIEMFQWYLAEENTNTYKYFAEEDADLIKMSSDFHVKKGDSPNGEIIALYRGIDPIAALIGGEDGKRVSVKNTNGLDNALKNLFK